MDFATRKRLYNYCNPNEALEPTDPRNVNIEESGEFVRGDSWVQKVLRRLQLSDAPICELFTGLPGSGKSTELRRLMAELEDPHRGRMLAVYVDAEQVLDLTNPVDVPDLLAPIVEATERRVLELEGSSPDGALRSSYVQRFWNWLIHTDVELTKAEFAIPDVSKLTIELKTRPSLRERIRRTVALHLTSFLQELRNELTALAARAKAVGYIDVVIIYDSVEKLRGISTNYVEVLDSCERVFSQGMPYVRLPVHVLYTVPPALLSRSRVPVDFFPMLKLRTRDGQDFEPGLAVARRIVEHRVAPAILREQLGPDWESRLQRLLSWSGGFPREIVRSLRAVVELDGPISEDRFERLLAGISNEYKDLIQRSEYEWLAELAVYKDLNIDNPEHRRVADRMLSSNAVMRYVNREDWWDVHPAVRAIPGVAQAVEKLNQRG